MSTLTEPLTFKLPQMHPGVMDALHEVVTKSVDRFTGRVVLDMQDGVVVKTETRTVRKTKRVDD